MCVQGMQEKGWHSGYMKRLQAHPGSEPNRECIARQKQTSMHMRGHGNGQVQQETREALRSENVACVQNERLQWRESTRDRQKSKAEYSQNVACPGRYMRWRHENKRQKIEGVKGDRQAMRAMAGQRELQKEAEGEQEACAQVYMLRGGGAVVAARGEGGRPAHIIPTNRTDNVRGEAGGRKREKRSRA